jgi:hypothetical protein
MNFLLHFLIATISPSRVYRPGRDGGSACEWTFPDTNQASTGAAEHRPNRGHRQAQRFSSRLREAISYTSLDTFGASMMRCS